MKDTTPNIDARRIVLCAVADDDHLHDVVAAGRALAKTGSFRVLFVHVASPAIRLRTPLGFGVGAGAAVAEAPAPAAKIDDLKDQAHRAGLDLVRGAGIAEHEAIIADGDPGTAIIGLAVEHDAALVVAGSHRRGAISSALVGSASRKLARDGPCPVLIARSRVLPCVGGPVVCGVDVSDDDDERAVRPAIHAAQLAHLMDRPLVLVHVLSASRRLPGAAGAAVAPQILRPTQRQRALLERVLEEVRLPARSVESLVVEGNSVAAGLDRFAAGRRADLLVVGARRRGVVQRALEGGVLRDLQRNGRQPLVIVPPLCADHHEHLGGSRTSRG